MVAAQSWFCLDGEDLVLRIHLQPRAREDAITGVHGDALRVRLKCPPVDGRANAALVAFLAAQFGLPAARVIRERGFRSRRKQIRVIAPPALPAAVRGLLAAG